MNPTQGFSLGGENVCLRIALRLCLHTYAKNALSNGISYLTLLISLSCTFSPDGCGKYGYNWQVMVKHQLEVASCHRNHHIDLSKPIEGVRQAGDMVSNGARCAVGEVILKEGVILHPHSHS